MDDKYQIIKKKKPETKQEIIQEKIEELIKQRDRESNYTAKQVLNAEITKLFAQYQRLNLWRWASEPHFGLMSQFINDSGLISRI